MSSQDGTTVVPTRQARLSTAAWPGACAPEPLPAAPAVPRAPAAASRMAAGTVWCRLPLWQLCVGADGFSQMKGKGLVMRIRSTESPW